jgi:hypothetical protein
MSTAVKARTQHDRKVVTRVAALMAVEAATLAVAATLHLTGSVTGRSSLFDADNAGIAEAIIAVVLAGGAIAMLGLPARARTIGVVVTGFAIVGFLIGLTMTARGGHLPDIAYHLVLLPALIGSLVALLAAGSPARADDRRGLPPRPPG